MLEPAQNQVLKGGGGFGLAQMDSGDIVCSGVQGIAGLTAEERESLRAALRQMGPIQSVATKSNKHPTTDHHRRRH